MPLSASTAILARLRRLMLAALIWGSVPALAVAADSPSPETCGLDSAEAAIATARERQALWTTAVKALAESGRLCLDGLITHRSRAGDADHAYRTAFRDPACLKMILDWRTT